MEYLLLAILIAVSLVGVLLALFQLPGIWLILAATAGYDWYYGWERIGWVWLAALTAAALLAEVLDAVAGAVAARKAGASRRAAIAAMLGGFAGMVLLSIPIPVIGTIIGGLLGCFAGALLAEMSLRRNMGAGAKVGLFATIGRLIGIIAKSAMALVIAGTAISLAIWTMLNPTH